MIRKREEKDNKSSKCGSQSLLTNHKPLRNSPSNSSIERGSQSLLTNHKSLSHPLFYGRWLVNYDPKEFSYPDILITLAIISDYFDENHIDLNSININFNKNGTKNFYFKENGDILLSYCDNNAGYEEKNTKPCIPATLKPLEKVIKTISLLFPRLENDPRWKSMGMPAGQMFLASSLAANGFQPSAFPLVLPGGNPPPETLSSDLAGITLFEDLLPVLRPFLADFRVSYEGVLAAGGPFPSLAPLAAAYHLPQINLWLRGEAELALPGILQALNQGDPAAFFGHEGVLWQQPGVIAMAGFDQVNRPEDFNQFAVNLDSLQPALLEKGLEMNFSRGCRRACVFCCRAQGTKFRKLSIEKAGELLNEYRKKVETLNDGGKSPTARRAPAEKGDVRDNRAPTQSHYTVNINDDDILQEPTYAGNIFSLIKKHSFRIYGIQTSIASLVNSEGTPREEILDLVADPGLYVEDRPLLWLGSDTFVPERARRLGKKLPPAEKFHDLLHELEKRGLRHFHYWISSDGDSTWEEFAAELALICEFFRDFPGFGLLAHAPFIVPYPSSRLFSTLETGDPRLKIKLALYAPDARFSYQVVDHLETRWPQLNNLLRNERAGGEKGFFDFLKEKDLMAAAQIAYYFLKQEKLQSSLNNPGLLKAQERLEELLGQILERQDN